MGRYRKKRVWRSILGIPIWVIISIAIFIVFSSVYEIIINDSNMMRYAVLIGSIVIIMISLGVHMISLDSISKLARGQMGR